jgi:hypothetical protein
MARRDPRVLVLVPLLLIAGGCGDDEPVRPAPVPATSAPSVAPSAAAPSDVPDPDDSVYVEEPEDPEPTAAAGDLSDEAQAQLDEAIGTELGALEGAPAETAAPRRKVLDALPDDPRQVLGALKNYVWYSPEARALYDKAVKAA